MNLQPLFSFILGFIILKERKANCLDFICLVLSMLGAYIMIIASVHDQKQIGAKDEVGALWVALLILLPFSKSMRQIISRIIRKMHDNTVSCFQQPV